MKLAVCGLAPTYEGGSARREVTVVNTPLAGDAADDGVWTLNFRRLP